FCGKRVSKNTYKAWYRAVHLPEDESFIIWCGNCKIQTEETPNVKEWRDKTITAWNKRVKEAK
ncbi:unnamed protein product, partial [marine sediment metagenome]